VDCGLQNCSIFILYIHFSLLSNLMLVLLLFWFAVVLTLSILLLILPTGQASLGIDQSILEISVTDYNGHGNISVLARNTDCWKVISNSMD